MLSNYPNNYTHFTHLKKKYPRESAVYAEGGLRQVKWREALWMGLFRELSNSSSHTLAK